jgi:alpha-glucosidase (family GH31 glycosyl hydrolase)
MNKLKRALCAALFIISWLSSVTTATTFIVGNVRVETLSPILVRLEVQGPEGFEDRLTYNIVNRSWPGDSGTSATNGGIVTITTADYAIYVPQGAASLSGITITDSNGNHLWSYGSLPGNEISLPGPTDNLQAWAIADTPRMIPPSWGYSVAPTNSANYSTDGWDLNNNAPDMYVFLPKGNLRRLRSDFNALTGPTQMLPLHALGTWDSRYYEYTEQTALQQIQNYQSNNFPLDNLVIDTQWRVGGGTGYAVNTNDFPDIARFFTEAHASNIWVMFNDHPQSVASALNPQEVAYRNTGLQSILTNGLDVWWYDKNWSVTLTSPSGLSPTEWGMYVYNSIISNYYPNRRPLIMANVDGVNGGQWAGSPEIACHRYDFQWTGDIPTGFPSLKNEIQNAVNEGIYCDFPYTSSDLGGHTADPTPENYVRWIQYGVLSPIVRPHCTEGLALGGRMPWLFGEPAESIARNYYNLRYRLLPYLYQLVRHNYDTGDPLLERCDFNYPTYSQASTNDQYLLGDRILVAPICTSSALTTVPGSWLTTSAGKSGLAGSYYNNTNLSGTPKLTRTDSQINFNWNNGSPGSGIPSTDFSVSWTGNITIGDTNSGYLGVISDDGVQLFIDGTEVANDWGPQDSTYIQSSVLLMPGTTHSITLEYLQLGGGDLCQLLWTPAAPQIARSVWIPPGNWIDAWTGTVYTGPQTISTSAQLAAIPIYIETGTIIPLAPQMSYTGQLPWDPVALDTYPDPNTPATNTLYEDDNISNGYQTGAYRTTALTAAANASAQTVTVEIMPAQGTFAGASSVRGWIVRIHKPLGFTTNLATSVTMDGVAATWSYFSQNQNQVLFEHDGSTPDSDVIVVPISSSSVATQHTVVVNYGGSLGTPPPPPTALTATAGNTLVSLNWTATSGATSYNVKRSMTSDAETIIATPTTTNYTDPLLTNNTTYYYVVSAVNDNGQSANSSEVSAMPQTPPLIRGQILAGQFSVQVTVQQGQTCVLETSTNLVQWWPMSTNTAVANGQMELTDGTSSEATSRFYRVQFQ